MRCVSAPDGLGRRSKCRQPDRRAAPTEARKRSIGKQSNQTLFCRLTLELSRPVAGRRTCASVAHSTRPTPRHGVGLNELLGGGGCGCKWHLGALAERRSGKARTRTRELTAGCNRSNRVSHGTLAVTNHHFRSRPTRRVQCVSAPDGIDRRNNVPGNLTEEQYSPKPRNQVCEQHNCRMLFCRLTPELSRPVAGRRTCASVAQSTRLTPRHGVGLNELLGGGGC